MGVLTPALNAWTIDLSLPDRRGKAVATMFIGLEAGIGLGALLSGIFYQDVIWRIPNIIVCLLRHNTNSNTLFAYAIKTYIESPKKLPTYWFLSMKPEYYIVQVQGFSQYSSKSLALRVDYFL